MPDPLMTPNGQYPYEVPLSYLVLKQHRFHWRELNSEAKLMDCGNSTLCKEGISNYGSRWPSRVLAPPHTGHFGVVNPVTRRLDKGSYHLQPSPPGVSYQWLQHRLRECGLHMQV